MARISQSLSIDPDFHRVLEKEYKRALEAEEVDSFSHFIIDVLKSIFEPESRYINILKIKDKIGHESFRATLKHLIHDAIKNEMRDEKY